VGRPFSSPATATHAGDGQAPRQRPGRRDPGLNIPTGIPLRYDLDADLHPVTRGGTYLDPEAAKAAIQAVANQGR